MACYDKLSPEQQKVLEEKVYSPLHAVFETIRNDLPFCAGCALELVTMCGITEMRGSQLEGQPGNILTILAAAVSKSHDVTIAVVNDGDPEAMGLTPEEDTGLTPEEYEALTKVLTSIDEALTRHSKAPTNDSAGPKSH